MAALGGGALVLIGFMGAGKSRTAREVASTLGTTLVDSDALLEERLGHPIAAEVEARGESSFRAQEGELVRELLARADRDAVVALGGGAVLSPEVQEALKAHNVIYLESAAEEAWRRLGPARASRPLARDRGQFERLLDERRPLYEELADGIVPAAAPAPFQSARERPLGERIAPYLRALQGAPKGTKLLWAWSRSAEYPVFVGSSLYASGQFAVATLLGPPLLEGRSFLVADRAVAAHYGRRLWPHAHELTVSGGEKHKTLATAERIWRSLARGGMRRSDFLVALGGGVVGDLVGFCAATYQRGVPYVQLPTTVVAQVDAAYGGKTGVDLPEAKNYVGAYHHPAAVITDLASLQTLPEAERNAGWVEVLKTALIAGGKLWQKVSAGAPLSPEIVFDCVRLKCQIVAADERDRGVRQLLNLGHTVGHAIEAATNYSRYRHGEAVGLGLLAALRLSSQPALRAQVKELLVSRGLPLELEGASVTEVVAAVGRDKKRLGERVPFVLVKRPGEVEAGCEVGRRELEAAVAELLPAKGRPARGEGAAA